jgi:hypothetical protein
VGHRPDEALRAAPARVAPDLGPLRRAASRAEYEGAWGRSTDREVDEAFDAPAADGAAALADCRDRQA